MAPIAANILAFIQLLVGLGVILVGLGFWGGKLEARRAGRNPMSTSPSDAVPPAHPIADLERRLQELIDDRREYVRMGDLNARSEQNKSEHDQIWREISNLRSVDNATTRRIDGLMGQG